MEYSKRNIDKILIEWKREQNRKPLLLRGARQVGKTSAVRELAKTFKHYIEIDFLAPENSDVTNLFTENSSIGELCQKIAVIKNTPIAEGETLIFLDEIQACPKAIEKLRYFYEQTPNLHVIAAQKLSYLFVF